MTASKAPAELATAKEQGYFSIGRAAEISGVTPKMIRHYESLELIPKAARTLGDYRVYTASDIHVLRFIRRARSLGFSMEEISDLLGLWRNQRRASKEVKRLALKHIEELDGKIEELQSMRAALAELAAHCHGVTGQGVRGEADGHRLALGNAVLMKADNVEVGDIAEQVEQLRREGRTVIFLSVDGKLAGAIAVGDAVKESTPTALKALKEDGLRLVMLTGDNHATAQAVAAHLPIDEVIAEVQPKDKADVIAHLQSQGRRVAMAGDGINDAPALARADVGIAMGTGTDIAMESAQVTLVKGDLRGIVRARQLSRATVRNIRQNLFFAFGYNALGIPLAAGVLYPFTGWLLSPLIAALAMSLSSVSVISNALRLRGQA